MKNYNIKDFLFKTKQCLSCSNKTQLKIVLLNSDYVLHNSYHELMYEFNDYGYLIITIASKFDKSKSSLISINPITHKYSSLNLKDDVSFAFVRSCSCDNYTVSTKPIFCNKEQGMLNPINIIFAEAIILHGRMTYIVTKSQNSDGISVSLSSSNKFYEIKSIDIIGVNKHNLIKKIEKYSLLL